VADALSCMPERGGEGSKVIATVLKISTDPKISDAIRVGYKSDAFCQCILKNIASFPMIRIDDGLIYIGSRLVVPRVGTIQEDLFQMAHDSLGYFGTEKS